MVSPPPGRVAGLPLAALAVPAGSGGRCRGLLHSCRGGWGWMVGAQIPSRPIHPLMPQPLPWEAGSSWPNLPRKAMDILRGRIQISIQPSHWRKTGQCLLVRQSALPSLHQLPPCLPVLASTCFRLVANLLFRDTSCHAYPKWSPRPHEPSCDLESVRLGSLTSNFFVLRTSQPTPLGLLCLVVYRYFRAFSMVWNFSTFWSYWTVSFTLQQFWSKSTKLSLESNLDIMNDIVGSLPIIVTGKKTTHC